MNCLLCNYKLPDVHNLKMHYTSYHRINPANFFFLQLFNQENKLVCKECLRCHEFLTAKAFMDKHNFLKHYSDGEKKPAEYKTIDIVRKKGITIYQISFEKHSNEYDFFNAEEVVDDFLFNVKNLFEPSTSVFFKADFALENIQAAPEVSENTTDIKSLRYWSKNVYKSVYLNHYVLAGIRNDILKRVISNKLSGSAWRFNRFSYLNLKVVEENFKLKV